MARNGYHHQQLIFIPKKLQRLLFLLVFLLLLTLVIIHVSQWSRFETFIGKSQRRLEVACNIPKLEPFAPSIRRFIKEAPKISCYEKLYFNSTLDSEVVPAVELEEFEKINITSCCYKVIYRKENKIDPDKYFEYSNTCDTISLTEPTKIPDSHEFIAIYCTNSSNHTTLYDMHALVPPLQNVTSKPPSEDQLNVLIFGIDSLSRMNFMRTMPKTYSYLKKLGAVDLAGYNKNGMNTFICLLPMLTSIPYKDIYEPAPVGCWDNYFFDSCPLIWKHFKKQGYITGWAEDWPTVAIFHHLKNGFRKSPSDYNIRPFALAVHKDMYTAKDSYIYCQGPRFTYHYLLDYMTKIVYRMDQMNQSFFHFTWSTAQTHAYLNYPMIMDDDMVNALDWLNQGYLDNTILIIMSDHGIHWGDIRKTPQGQLEARLPFINIVFPKIFKEKYSRAYKNIQNNRERLTSALDIYHTLKDISNLRESLKNEVILDREKEMETLKEPPKGISQFLPIPPHRTCADAGIEEFYCACKEGMREISPDTLEVQDAALFAVSQINRLVRRHWKCAHVKLRNVTNAQFIMTRNGIKNGPIKPGYLINFETTPGNGGFEAFVIETKENDRHRFRLSGSIARASLYGNQSYCTDDSDLKYYCYCKN